MEVIVRKRRTKKVLYTLKGEVHQEVLELLYDMYGYNNVEDGEERINIEDTEWYQKRQKQWGPGKTLKIHRQNQGLTKKQIGEKIGQTAKFITEIENGKRKLNKNLIKKFAKLFDVPVSKLIHKKSIEN